MAGVADRGRGGAAARQEGARWVRRVGHPVPSYAGLTRVSILLRKSIFQRGWIAGSSPAMTELWWARLRTHSRPTALPTLRATHLPP
jgi:hypothetical protein